MSLNIRITQEKGFFKKEINIKDLIQSDYECGFRDVFGRLRHENYSYGTLVVYHPEHIGKGVIIPWKSSRREEIELNVEFPATIYDIEVLYELTKRICAKWKTEMFYQNEEAYTLVNIEELCAIAKMNNMNHLAWNQGEDVEEGIVRLQGVMWPLYLKEEQIESFSLQQDAEGFAQFLHNYQKEDLYYASPIVYRLPEDLGYVGIFAITATTESIIPMEPFRPMHSEAYPLNLFVVSLVSLEEQRIVGRISFADFLESVDAKHLEKYDEKHYLLPPLSEEEIHTMARLEDPLKDFEISRER
ncbi:MAG: DUF4299 family protein [Solobacterium sp.]|nr:DUF4299 family protein [Solobacterium sp.]